MIFFLERSIELLRDIMLNLGLYGLVDVVVLLKEPYLLGVFRLEFRENRCHHCGWNLKRWAGVCGNDKFIVAEKKESGWRRCVDDVVERAASLVGEDV